MSVAYDKALEIIEDDVHANCDYSAYLTLRDAVDAMDGVEGELRDLVRDMWDVFECDPYGTCKHRRECDENYECVFKSRLRDLGVEVDDE